MAQSQVRNRDSRRTNTIPTRSTVTRPPTGSPGVPRSPGTSTRIPTRNNPDRGGIFGRTTPIRPYCPRPTEIYPGARYLNGVSFRNWNRGFWFLSDLNFRYGSFNRRDSLWRMATGVSPLTPDALRLSTRESRSAARSLLDAAAEIDELIDAYQQRSLTAKEFRKAVEDRTDRIRDDAKSIRKDRLLDFVDVRKDRKTVKSEKARSLDELRQLSADLRRLALDLQEALAEYGDGDLAQVVSLQHLERPSVDTLSKSIDSLAKTIEKSADKL